MMYPRLYLAKNLLREDGVIFISIDDIEMRDLRSLCDEIFGEENFIDNIIWKKRYGGGAKEKHLVSVHEYILAYAKDINSIGELFVPYSQETIDRYYTQRDENYKTRGPYRTHPLEATKSMGERKNLVFRIPTPDGNQVMPKRQWLWGKERVETALAKDELAFSQDKDGNWTIHTKQYLRDENGTIRQSKAFSIIDDVYTQHGTNEIIELFGDAQVFSFPKPTGLMKPLLDLATNKDSIILDFFAGSGTTADAVIQMNKKDNGNRKYLLVQLPEPCAQESIAFKAGFKTIADIGKERIRRVIHKLNAADAGKMVLDGVNKQDRGFRVFKLAESNFKTWDAQGAHDAAELEKQLEMHITHIRADRSPDDILSEIILKSGFSLTVPVVKLDLAGKIVFNIDDGALFICLEHELTLPLIRAMAEKKPARVVCLDAGFAGNDQLKTNAVLIFKNKGVTSFKTI
jgi:adenine-specific DNA-methyltransferase